MQVVGNTDASGNIVATYNLGATPTIIQPSVQNAGAVQLTAQPSTAPQMATLQRSRFSPVALVW
ncbi:hypothetical protein BN2476_750075 [Paraburkholderia piptadeniae]|uniref:Uncharacterized protein n=1 Tax=Paraburkholderia piptadeniae TaxID=1701573 RepID=A0A1N7SS17_9BURK|nr:hypothetical protein BN2476_750075 [Paraburkholderia piptadeniae]